MQQSILCWTTYNMKALVYNSYVPNNLLVVYLPAYTKFDIVIFHGYCLFFFSLMLQWSIYTAQECNTFFFLILLLVSFAAVNIYNFKPNNISKMFISSVYINSICIYTSSLHTHCTASIHCLRGYSPSYERL